MSLGGASIAQPDEPLEAIGANPAGLGLADSPMLQLGGFGAFADGQARTAGTRGVPLQSSMGAAPEFAFTYALRSAPVAFGVGIVPQAAAGLDWRFDDPPGGLTGTTSYGRQRHAAEFLAIRGAAGVSLALNEKLSLGASLGVVYNRNSLHAPYTFQAHPILSGFKTLLDLEADGWGVNGNVGLIFRPHKTVSLALAYVTPTSLSADGHAAGNASAQLRDLGGAFTAVRPDFRYDARVETGLPQTLSAGLSWQVCPRARWIAQVDWMAWSDSFDHLDIRLTSGNNPDLNTFLGTDQIKDSVPLHWSDQFVYRTGIEVEIVQSVLVRMGYAYGERPVSSSTLTPMSAAILEHTLSAGAEWRMGRYSIAGAYQYQIPSRQETGTSALRSGEYSGSRTSLSTHWIGVTTGVRF